MITKRVKRKLNKLPLHIKVALTEYKKSGRVAFLYPYKERISLNGGKAIPYAKAYKKMIECKNKEERI